LAIHRAAQGNSKTFTVPFLNYLTVWSQSHRAAQGNSEADTLFL